MTNNALTSTSQPNWGPNGEAVYERTYRRIKQNGQPEEWIDTVTRVVDGNLSLVDKKYHEKNEREKLIDLFYSFKALPAGRHLWMSGVPGRQFLFNCHHAGWSDDVTTHFSFTFDQLMQGGGVGANYSNKYIRKYPKVKHVVDVHMVCDPDHPDYYKLLNEGLLSSEYSYEWDGATRVEDSREGWTEALSTLLESFWNGVEVLVLDISLIRAEGAKIKTFGGTAAGPMPLARLLLRTSRLLASRVGEKISSLDAMLIDHWIGDCVVSGNVRRSARMSIKNWADYDIFEFINCKEDSGEHWSTNISVEIDDAFFRALKRNDKHATDVYRAVVTGMLTNGEPGFYNRSLAQVGETGEVASTNPCGEICLEEYENCNLGHVNIDAFYDDFEGAVEAHRLMARFLIRATFADVPNPLQRAVLDRNRRIGVGHFGFQGWLVKQGIRYSDSHRNAHVRKTLRDFYQAVRKEAHRYAFQLRIPEPIKVTTVAPTGCQKPDTMLLTDQGVLRLDELIDQGGKQWQEIEDLKVAQEDGFYNATKGFVNGFADTKKVLLYSGIELESTHNHKYRIVRDGEYVWVRADEIIVGDKIPSRIGGYNKLNDVKLITDDYVHTRAAGGQPKSILFPDYLNPDFAWFLGLFYADGSVHSRGIRISLNSEDTFLIDTLVETTKALFGIKARVNKDPRENMVSVYLNSVVLKSQLEKNGLLKQKTHKVSIPRAVRQSSSESLRSFIRGYWDGDGSVTGNTRYIDTCSREMAEQLAVCMRATGTNARIKMDSNRESSIGDRPIYRVYSVGYGSDNFDGYRYISKDIREDIQVARQFGHDMILDKVVEISDGYNMTLDISVPENNCYVANSVISHNTVAKLAGRTEGAHPILFKYYKNRVRFSTVDPDQIIQLEDFMAKGYDVEDDLYTPNTKVVSFIAKHSLLQEVEDLGLDADYLVEAASEIPLGDMLAVQAMYQEYYTDNAISFTINMVPQQNQMDYIKDQIEQGVHVYELEMCPPPTGVVEDAMKTLIHYLPSLKGTTIMVDGSRPQSPYESLTKEEYESYTNITIGDGIDENCANGACPVR